LGKRQRRLSDPVNIQLSEIFGNFYFFTVENAPISRLMQYFRFLLGVCSVAKIDSYDRKLLNLIQEDASVAVENLAGEIGLSTSATHRRLARLRDEGFVISTIAVVDRKKIGRPMMMLVEVQIERERPELLNQFNLWIKQEKAVQQAWYITGDADFTMIVTATDMDDFDRLMERLLAENRNVRRFKTGVVLRSAKEGLFTPV
jgi:Lrp/AsnC family transcriptional regulator, leucine-responsive regulatory protein